MRNHSYENDLDLHENKTTCITHLHVKGFALRLVLKQRHKRTRKWPVTKTGLKFSNCIIKFFCQRLFLKVFFGVYPLIACTVKKFD